MGNGYFLYMSNLIPTPRTDKNGHVVVRHMKPSQEPSSLSRLSAVAPVLQEAEGTPLTHGEIADLLRAEGQHVEDAEKCLELLQEKDDGVLPLAWELLTTGNSDGRKLVAGKLAENMLSIAESYEKNPAKWRRTTFKNRFLAPELAKVWSIANVCEELGMSLDIDDKKSFYQVYGPISNYHYVLHQGMYPKAAVEPDYWRGFIALFHVKSERPYIDIENAEPFMTWAGKHENLRAVVDVARERETLDVNTLSGVLEDQNPSSPVRDGVL